MHQHARNDEASGPLIPGRESQIRRVLWLTLVLNLFVCGLKLGYGYATNALSMVADGFHSLADSSSNVIGLVAMHWASRRLGSKHRVEAAATLMIAGLLFFSCYEILYHAYLRTRDAQNPTVTVFSFVVMLLTMAVNYAVSHYEHRRGEQLNSPVLKADAAHTRSDIYASISVLVALAGAWWHWPILDGIAAIFIAIFIGYSGYSIVLENFAIFFKKKK